MKKICRNLVLIFTPYHFFLYLGLKKNGHFYGEDFCLVVGNTELINFCESIIRNIQFVKMDINFIEYPKSLLHKIISKLYLSIDNLTISRFDNIITFNDNHTFSIFISRLFPEVNTILIEEGIGLYRDVIKRYSFIKKFLAFLKRNTSSKKRLGEENYVDEILCTSPGNLNSLQLKKNVSTFNINSIHSSMSSLKIKLQNNNEHVEKIIFVGQPLIEDAILTKKRYFEICKEVFEEINNYKSSYQVFYKPHPREKFYRKVKECGDATKINILEAGIPLELYDIEPSTTLISLFSSAILNIREGKKYLLYKVFPEFSNLDLDNIDFNTTICVEKLSKIHG